MAEEIVELKLSNQEMYKELLRLRDGPSSTSDHLITYDTAVKHGNDY